MDKMTQLDIQKTTIKGVTIPILWGIVASTMMITSTALFTYYGIKEEMQADRSASKLRQTEVDSRFDKLQIVNDSKFENINQRIIVLESRIK